MCVGGGAVGGNPDSSASLVLVPHFILPENTQNDLVSTHKCYTLFLVRLAWPKNVFVFVCALNDMGRGRTGSRGLPSQNFSISPGDV